MRRRVSRPFSDRRHHGFQRNVGIRRHKQGIGPGFERAYGRLGPAKTSGDAAHLERVRHHQTFEAQLVAQQVREDGRRKRGGQIGRRQRGHGDVRGHDGIHARFDGRAKRRQFQAFQAFAIGVDGGQVHVRIDGCVAVARKMFGGGQHEIALVGMCAFNEGLHVRGHILRILAKRADVDDGVVGIVVDVGHRVVDPVNAQCPRFPRRDFTLEARKGRVSRGAKRHGMRKDGGSFHPHRGAPLEISTHQQRHSSHPLHEVQKRRQRVRLGLPHHPAVGRIGQDQAADLGLPDKPREVPVLVRPRIRRRALERDEDQLRHLIAQCHTSHPAADGGRRLRPG